MDRQVALGLADGFIAGWSHNLPKLISLFSDDVVYEDVPSHSVLRGPEEINAFAEDYFKVFPDITFAATSTVITDDHLTIVWRAKATQRGDMPGMPASNKTVDFAGVSVMEYKDGKITRNGDYYDFATIMQQLGFLPKM